MIDLVSGSNPSAPPIVDNCVSGCSERHLFGRISVTVICGQQKPKCPRKCNQLDALISTYTVFIFLFSDVGFFQCLCNNNNIDTRNLYEIQLPIKEADINLLFCFNM